MGALVSRLLDELASIRVRLLVVNLLVVAVPIAGIGFARFYEREMLRSLEDDMVNQAHVLRSALLADAAGLRIEAREPLIAAAAAGTRTRIRLLDASGHVAADSHRHGPPEGPEPAPPSFLRSASARAEPSLAIVPDPVDPAERPEVRRALLGQYGAATRLWEGGDRLFLFSAVPVTIEGKVQAVVYVTRSTNAVRAALYRIRSKLLLVLAASVIATAAITLFLSTTISRPLTRLTRTAERIASGDRTRRLGTSRRDEIGQLSRAFDAMTRNLDARARSTRDLAANISHEFKSPLTSIRGAAELLLEGAAEDPAARTRFLENVLADAHRLDRLVSRLLELARMEAEPSPDEVVDYEALVREAASDAGPHVVRVTYGSKVTQLRGRRENLASVLRNLLDNAQQHADEGSPITVLVEDVPGGFVRTTIQNSGVPISAANLARMWDRFFTTRGERGGSGLGLPIVATVVGAHGGRVTAASDPEQGTRFSFELPSPSAQ